ncbi:MAG: 3-methyl-2-oxobutanoate hydroxymethyltransferase [Candidatus Dormibacteraeota bacterium]|uniref:3-methyl-2-oxobutanoate hydroxymethyltransferase n=1 Tax=Candidatus Amunia macphersoniae TaxID=3127014 RepID=A0A934KQD5_9BACT|nr:3-methyl-2-oxobutanoate hydroxymethyltransferase [Candidatus Dormibacteraeota bacterium]
MPITIHDLRAHKERGERFVMVTAYDTAIARLLAEAGVPALLVGDSVGNNHLGYSTTLPVTMGEMLHHGRAVVRGAPGQLLIADMPFGSYHQSAAQAVASASAFLKAGLHGVKLEGGGWVAGVTERLVECGIPVMGHLGLTPQFVNAFGGFRVQGRSSQARERILADARALESAGAFSIVLEGIPSELAAAVTAAVAIPTIGIGAGPGCDGQVLVVYDLLGITRGSMPKFARAYADIGDSIVAATRAFSDDVAAGVFPDDAHSYR